MSHLKDPDAVLDYGCHWGDWLGTGETIVSSTWELDSSSVVQDSSTFDDTSTTVWLSGGTVGEVIHATNHIVTSAGREDDRTLTIRVKER